MALSGTITGSFSGMPSDRSRPRIVWSATQSISRNYSNVTATLYFDKLHSSWGWHYNLNGPSFSVTINGNSTSKSVKYDLRNRSTQTIMSHTVRVPHNSNGSKSITISAGGNTGTVGSISLSEKVTLETIPRASSITSFSMAGAIVNGSSTQVRLGISRASTSFTHDITLLDGNTAIASWIGEGIPTSLKVTDSEVNGLMNRMSNVTSKSLTLRVQTKSGNTNIGSAVTATATVTIASSVEPSIGSISISEAVDGLTAQFGDYVQSKSRLDISMSSSAGYGATVRSRNISANGTSYNSNSATTSELRSSGTMRINFSVTDSRGRSTSTTRDVAVLPYSNPYVSSISAERADETGNLDDQGEYVRVKYRAGVSPVNNKNTKNFVLRYRRSNKSVWTTVKLPNDSYSYDSSVVIGPLETDYSYDLQLTASDYFSASDGMATAPSTGTLMNFSATKSGVAIKRAYNEEIGGALQVYDDSHFFDPVHFHGGIQSIRLSRETDLNDVTTPGFYHTPLSSDAGTIENTPIDAAFSLLVEKHAGAKQTLTRYDTSNPATYIRNMYQGSWGPWRIVATSTV